MRNDIGLDRPNKSGDDGSSEPLRQCFNFSLALLIPRVDTDLLWLTPPQIARLWVWDGPMKGIDPRMAPTFAITGGVTSAFTMWQSAKPLWVTGASVAVGLTLYSIFRRAR